VRMRMFAILRERSGVSEMELELAEGATVADAIEEVGKRFASVSGLLARTSTTVNLEFAKPGRRLDDGDELALIPPVSGG